MTVQDFRDMVRPILTLQISTAYIALDFFAYYRKDIGFGDALGLLGTYFGSILTYHFLKSSRVDMKGESESVPKI